MAGGCYDEEGGRQLLVQLFKRKLVSHENLREVRHSP